MIQLFFADRECPELSDPELGRVTVTGRLFGDRASYTCQHGYHVVGLQSRTCQADGQWAGQAPACKQNSKHQCCCLPILFTKQTFNNATFVYHDLKNNIVFQFIACLRQISITLVIMPFQSNPLLISIRRFSIIVTRDM